MTPGAPPRGPSSPQTSPPGQPLLATSLEQAQRTLELREERIRALEATTAEQASELATLRLELATARAAVGRLEEENTSLRATGPAPVQDPLLPERLHDLEKQVAEYQQALERRAREVQQLEAKVQELQGKLKIQVLNAGIDVSGPFRDL